MARIFISHRNTDQGIAERLASLLRAQEHEITGDLSPMLTATDWDTHLLDGLQKSDAVVFLFTKDAITSEYMLSETGAAKVLQHIVGRPHLIPIVFPGGKLPDPISRVPAIVVGTQTLEELALAVHARIMAQPAAKDVGLGAFPTTVTLAWLWHHLPVAYWFMLLGAAATIFTTGIAMGQLEWVKQLARITPTSEQKEKPTAAQRPILERCRQSTVRLTRLLDPKADPDICLSPSSTTISQQERDKMGAILLRWFVYDTNKHTIAECTCYE